jgi:hypothetical protein
MRTTRSNVPQNEPLKWNVEKGAAEFSVSIGTLRKALAKNSAEPDSDGLFSTRQIIAALYGALDQEKLATQKELTKRYQLNNCIVEASVLNRAEVAKGLAAIADAVVSRIMSSGLARSEKEDILRDISSWPAVLETTARAQSRLPRGGNGQTPEGSGETVVCTVGTVPTVKSRRQIPRASAGTKVPAFRRAGFKSCNSWLTSSSNPVTRAGVSLSSRITFLKEYGRL